MVIMRKMVYDGDAMNDLTIDLMAPEVHPPQRVILHNHAGFQDVDLWGVGVDGELCTLLASHWLGGSVLAGQTYWFYYGRAGSRSAYYLSWAFHDICEAWQKVTDDVRRDVHEWLQRHIG